MSAATLCRQALVAPAGTTVCSVGLDTTTWADWERIVADLQDEGVEVRGLHHVSVGLYSAMAHAHFDAAGGIRVMLSSPDLEFEPDGSVRESSLEPLA